MKRKKRGCKVCAEQMKMQLDTQARMSGIEAMMSLIPPKPRPTIPPITSWPKWVAARVLVRMK